MRLILTALALSLVIIALVSLVSIQGVAYADLGCDNKDYRWSCAELASVIYCESNGKAWIENGDSIGLLQIHLPSHWDKLARLMGRDWRSYADSEPEGRLMLKDPAINLAVGYIIWRDNKGWTLWSCKP